MWQAKPAEGPGWSRRAFLSASAAALSACRTAESRPNIVVLFADDLGYGDLGCFGAHDIRTPRLDRLASQGVRLTNHLVAAPVCSPSRAGLLTGRYPARVGIEGVLRDHHDELPFPDSEQTLAERLRQGGYATALIGKWHLGMSPESRPNRRGFDYFWGFLNGTIDYFTHESRGGGWTGRPALFRNDEPIKAEGYFPELLQEEAVRWIEADHDRPFFLYASFALPHTPLQAPPRWLDEYAGLEDQSRATYAAMVSCLDDGVGRILDALDRKGLAENTLVLFLSDHGWARLGGRRHDSSAGDNGPFQGGKYELTEGGLRTPCIVRWPGRIQPGVASRELTWTLDWFPTLAGLAGAPDLPRNPLDGRDIAPALTDGAEIPERTLYWRFADDVVKTPFSLAARRGAWKYLRVGETERLFDLEADPGERNDLAAAEPQRFAELRAAAERWNQSMGPWDWVSRSPA
ncbi:MAG: sulfatase-like hydrolase/transferase [Acidobacteria bacterium]|nr:sulfatase-like hydrolase/transferase [Acidobacteriota bacterium]